MMKKKNEGLNALKLVKLRDDGTFYTTTVGERKEREAQEKMKQFNKAQKASKRARNKQIRKEKRVHFKQAHGKRIWNIIQLIGILALIIIIGRILLPIIIVGIVMMAVGGGVSDAGNQMSRQNEQNRNAQNYRDGKPPRYWK